EFKKARYASFESGIGKKIREKKTTLEELAAIADEMGAPALPGSGKQEHLEAVINQVIFG
ncbi:MAG: xylose isomerase, partial [Clostridia bacterium]|nr:xylose isomerase [Clostridia bacterium]